MSEVLIKSKTQPIGAILRIVREKLGKKQGDIASAADISISMLSQIERGAVSPSIDTLMAVCAALHLDMSELFRRVAPSSPVKVVRSGQRLFTKNNGVRYEQLVVSSDATYPAEMFLLEVQPGKRAGMSGLGHAGVEMGYVLQGHATITIDLKEYELAPGDSLSFSSQVSHVLANKGSEVFKAIWTVMPPHKDYLGTE